MRYDDDCIWTGHRLQTGNFLVWHDLSEDSCLLDDSLKRATLFGLSNSIARNPVCTMPLASSLTKMAKGNLTDQWHSTHAHHLNCRN